MFLWPKPVSFSLIHFLCVKSSSGSPVKQNICAFSACYDIWTYTEDCHWIFLNLLLFHLDEKERGWLQSVTQPVSFSVSHTKLGRLAVTLNLNVSPILKCLNWMLEALRVNLQSSGIRRWRAKPMYKHHLLLSYLEGGQLMTWTHPHSPLPEPAPWARESM